MKNALTNMDIYVLAKELRYSRLEKLGRLTSGYKLKARPGRDLLILNTLAIPTAYSVPASDPDVFCQIFRKHLSGARVTSVQQINFDRILKIETDRGSIIFELFGRGNIILVDEEERIIAATEYREWSARKIFRGEPYSPPPPPRIHPTVTFDEFSKLFTARDVVRSLVRAGLPPTYAEEVCFRAGVDKETSTENLQRSVLESLYDAFLSLIRSLDSPTPTVYYQEGGIFDITPIPLQIYTHLEKKTFSSLSEALDQLTPVVLSQPSQQEKKKDIRAHLLAEREKIVQEIQEIQKMIDAAYAHAQEIMEQMERAKRGEAPNNIGPFVLKRWNRKEIVYSFTPQT